MNTITRKEPVVVAVCGIKNSGKTTFLEKLVQELSGQGVGVAVIKHDGHDFEGDVPGTDSYRMYQAGARGTAIFSDTQVLIHRRQQTRLEELIEAFSDCDLILVEGAKDSEWRKLEILREGISDVLVSNPVGRIGILTDRPDMAKRYPKERIFDLNRPKEVAQMLRNDLEDR